MTSTAANAARQPLAAWIVVAVLVGLVGLSSAARIHTALTSPLFDTQHAEGLLRSDPGLLFYLTSRVVGAGGGVPADWRADPRIEHPDVVDIPAVFTVGQEFLVAWTWRVFGGDLPLHVFCVIVMGIVASLSVPAVYGVARSLSGGRAWGLLAAALFVATPANYRTLGFILVREDLSLPLFALHLALLARAWRGPSAWLCLGCGAALGAALATWHAMTFIAAIEAVCLWAWMLRTGQNPLAARHAGLGLAVAALMALSVPVLREKVAILSPPLAIGLALWLCARLGFDASPLRRSLLSTGVVAGVLALGGVFGTGDFSHVLEVMAAKLRTFGQLPDDPNALSFEARMLWQGPFATLEPAALWRKLGFVLPIALPFALAQLWSAASPRQRADADDYGGAGAVIASALLLAGLGLGLLVSRLLVIAGLAAPVVAVLALSWCARRVAPFRPALAGAIVSAGLFMQGVFFANWVARVQLGWYLPAVRRPEIETLVRALPRFVPEGEAVTADFMISTAVLAQTNRPIVLQPKWERARTRERLERFWLTFYRGTPDELRRLVVGTFQSRWLLVDRSTMLFSPTSRYLAGMRPDAGELADGSAAEWLLGQDARALQSIPGYELVYRSPARWQMPDGSASDFFRLYRLDPLDAEPER